MYRTPFKSEASVSPLAEKLDITVGRKQNHLSHLETLLLRSSFFRFLAAYIMQDARGLEVRIQVCFDRNRYGAHFASDGYIARSAQTT